MCFVFKHYHENTVIDFWLFFFVFLVVRMCEQAAKNISSYIQADPGSVTASIDFVLPSQYIFHDPQEKIRMVLLDLSVC